MAYNSYKNNHIAKRLGLGKLKLEIGEFYSFKSRSHYNNSKLFFCVLAGEHESPAINFYEQIKTYYNGSLIEELMMFLGYEHHVCSLHQDGVVLLKFLANQQIVSFYGDVKQQPHSQFEYAYKLTYNEAYESIYKHFEDLIQKTNLEESLSKE